MRHRSTKVALSRKTGPRQAVIRNLVASFVLHGAVVTTPAKAKIVRRLAERYITRGRKNTLANRRLMLAFFPTRKPVDRILTELSPKYATRPGGYTRVIKLAPRKGDGAAQVKLELV